MTIARLLGLEISPRMTGKTTRLIAKAKEHLAKGNLVRVVCCSGHQGYFSKQLPGALVRSDRQQFPANLDPEDGVWFYDEFEWLTNAELRSNAYYYSSPRFIRKIGCDSGVDLLLRLLNANEGRFERHYWCWDMSECLEGARLTYAPDEFRRLFLGEFFE